QGQEKLSCNPQKENGSHVVVCELGNPMKAGARIAVDMELSVSGLEDAGDTITFLLQLRRAPPWLLTTAHPLPLPTVLSGPRDPGLGALVTSLSYPPQTGAAEGSRRLEDHGLKVEHVYQLHNKGPSTVSGVTLHLAVPSQLQGSLLLYLLELGTEGGMSCAEPPGLNSKQV
ncbi:Integrin alpha-IIb, partial [Struthio camelus australis]